MTLWCTPVERPFHSTIRVPGSKSIANRALICAALSEGRSTLKNLPDGDDTGAMLSGLQALGIEVTRSGSTATVFRDAALQSGEIHAELAGTTSRFLTALAATAGSSISIDGHERLRQRPIGPLLSALRSLGAQIADHDGGLPVSIQGPLRGGAVTIDATTSSQFISALMMIGPVLPEGLHITLQGSPISQPYVNLTASVMELFGVSTDISEGSIGISPQEYLATSVTIEPDASSASYPLAIAAATGSTVTIEDFGSSSLQGDKQIIDILREMNADIDCTSHSTTVTSNGRDLVGIDIDMSEISDLVPTVAALACFAASTTRIRGVGFIRNKESDRIGDLASELSKFGAHVVEHKDGLTISPVQLMGATVDTHDDHRLAMAFSIIGACVPGTVITNPEVTSKSWPSYWEDLNEMILVT